MLNDDFIRDLSSRPAFEHLTLLVGCGVTRRACDSVTEYSFTALSRTHLRRKQRISPSIQRGCQALPNGGWLLLQCTEPLRRGVAKKIPVGNAALSLGLEYRQCESADCPSLLSRLACSIVSGMGLSATGAQAWWS